MFPLSQQQISQRLSATLFDHQLATIERADAAVLLGLQQQGDELDVLLTRRADHLKYHGGEVAFPGGRREYVDASPQHTALRETEEELGVAPHTVKILGAMPTVESRFGNLVVPYVGVIQTEQKFIPCPNEIADVFTVPVAYLLQDPRVRTDVFARHDVEGENEQKWAPVYHYGGFEIWGFTARILAEFLNKVYGADIKRDHPSAPEKLWT